MGMTRLADHHQENRHTPIHCLRRVLPHLPTRTASADAAVVPQVNCDIRCCATGLVWPFPSDRVAMSEESPFEPRSADSATGTGFPGGYPIDPSTTLGGCQQFRLDDVVTFWETPLPFQSSLRFDASRNSIG